MGRPRLIAVLGLIVIAALAALRECSVRRNADRVFDEWLTRNCAVGERGVLERELRNYSSRLEPRLEKAFLEGPPPGLVNQWMSVAQREKDEVVAAIGAGKSYGLGPEEVSRLKTQSTEKASVTDVEDLVQGYRSAAIAGLIVINTESSQEFLRAVQRDPKQREFWGVAGQKPRRPTPARK